MVKWAEVSGLGALPQQVKMCLSHQKGESPIFRDLGTRFAEYYGLLSGSPWFERYPKLGVIRQDRPWPRRRPQQRDWACAYTSDPLHHAAGREKFKITYLSEFQTSVSSFQEPDCGFQMPTHFPSTLVPSLVSKL